MQASGWAAKRTARRTGKVFEVQDDPLEVVSVVREFMESPWRAALANNRVTNFGRKVFDVLRIVAIFASIAAALRERLIAYQQHQDKSEEIPRSYKRVHGAAVRGIMSNDFRAS